MKKRDDYSLNVDHLFNVIKLTNRETFKNGGAEAGSFGASLDGVLIFTLTCDPPPHPTHPHPSVTIGEAETCFSLLPQDSESVVLHTLGGNSFKVFLADGHEPLQSLKEKKDQG